MAKHRRNVRVSRKRRSGDDAGAGCLFLLGLGVIYLFLSFAWEMLKTHPALVASIVVLSIAAMVGSIFGVKALKARIIEKRNSERLAKIGAVRFAIENGEYLNMSGESYENYVATRLKELRYHSIETTKASGDHGADIIAYAPDGVKCAIQCKYYSKPVGNKAVQEALAGMVFYKCDRAIVITNNAFTKQAIEDANRMGVDLMSRF